VSELTHVLIVDDNDFARSTLERCLEEEGYQITAVASGSEALSLLSGGHIDLVLLDLDMPEVSGFDVLRDLRGIYSRQDLPVIIVTGTYGSQDTVSAFDQGANDFVTKPVNLPQLLARIRTQLECRSPEVSPSSKIEIGTVVGGSYRLDELIGKGRFGSVYRATHLKLRRQVAIKLLQADFQTDSDALARFEVEGISTCRIQHPNAVSVLDFNVTPTGVPYLVLELLKGFPLSDELAQKPWLSPQRSLEILSPVCEVLSEAHGLDIIHRDIKPQNIFLHHGRTGEVVKVLDFGIAKMLGDGHGHDLTMEGSTPGTPTYMSPERLSDLPYDGRSDVYSLGILLYTMLTGQPPFAAKNPIKVAMMHLYDRPAPPHIRNPELSMEIEDVVLHALGKDPESRPSAAELASNFKAAVTGAA
jgi:serine/threonine protein kinase